MRSVGVITKSWLLLLTIVAIVVVVGIVRFLVHEMFRFVEISAVLVLIILVLAWLLGRKSTQPKVSQP